MCNLLGALIENWAVFPTLHNELTWGWASFTCVKSKFSNEYFVMFGRKNFLVKPPSNRNIFSVWAPLNERLKIILVQQFETNSPVRSLTSQTIWVAFYEYRHFWQTRNKLGWQRKSIKGWKIRILLLTLLVLKGNKTFHFNADKTTVVRPRGQR